MAKEIVQPSQPRAYLNPDVSHAGPSARPRQARPLKPTGAYLAREPLEFEQSTKRGDKTEVGRIRIEVGKRLPKDTPETTIASLEAQKLIEPEYAEDTEE